jgi:hypothetical protein
MTCTMVNPMLVERGSSCSKASLHESCAPLLASIKEIKVNLTDHIQLLYIIFY